MADFDSILDDLIQKNYYSEEWELQGEVLAWVRSLSPEEQQDFSSAFHRRFASDPSIVNASLAAVLPYPGLDTLLAEQLNRVAEPGATSRTLIAALRAQRGSQTAFQAVERFVDSSQEMEALRALCAIDFTRARPHLRRAMQRNDLLESCLHLFAERLHESGLEVLLNDLRDIAGNDPQWIAPRLNILLRRIKVAGAHPLSDADQEAIARAFPGA